MALSYIGGFGYGPPGNYATSVQTRKHPFIGSVQISGDRFVTLDSAHNLGICRFDSGYLGDFESFTLTWTESEYRTGSRVTLFNAAPDVVAALHMILDTDDIPIYAAEVFFYDVSGDTPSFLYHWSDSSVMYTACGNADAIEFSPFQTTTTDDEIYVSEGVATCYGLYYGASLDVQEYLSLSVTWDSINADGTFGMNITVEDVDPSVPHDKPINNSFIGLGGETYGVREDFAETLSFTPTTIDVSYPTNAFTDETGLNLHEDRMWERVGFANQLQEFVYVQPITESGYNVVFKGSADTTLAAWYTSDGQCDASLVNSVPYNQDQAIIHFSGIVWSSPVASLNYHWFFRYTTGGGGGGDDLYKPMKINQRDDGRGNSGGPGRVGYYGHNGGRSSRITNGGAW